MNIIADIIKSIHILFILFILITPFTCKAMLWILHISFTITILIHWYMNNNICCLSATEAYFRGIPYTESFTHDIIAPVYDFLNISTGWDTICYVLLISLMAVSIYKIYNNYDEIKSKLLNIFNCEEETEENSTLF